MESLLADRREGDTKADHGDFSILGEPSPWENGAFILFFNISFKHTKQHND